MATQPVHDAGIIMKKALAETGKKFPEQDQTAWMTAVLRMYVRYAACPSSSYVVNVLLIASSGLCFPSPVSEYEKFSAGYLMAQIEFDGRATMENEALYRGLEGNITIQLPPAFMELNSCPPAPYDEHEHLSNSVEGWSGAEADPEREWRLGRHVSFGCGCKTSHSSMRAS